MSVCDLCGWYAHDKETFVECMPVVKGGVELSAKEAPVKEKIVGWKPAHFYLRCCERLDIWASMVSMAGGEGVGFVVPPWE